MRNLAQVLDDLRAVRASLLAPSATALSACEDKLKFVIRAIRQCESTLPIGELQPLVKDISMLLESARAFWTARQIPSFVGQHYEPGGRIPPIDQPSTFAIEV